MKILGVGEEKYICEVSWDEMYYILGGDDEDMGVQAGEEVDLIRVVKAAKWIRELDNEHIERVIKELRTTLAGMEKVKETAGALNLFNKLGEEQL
jgi:hypothetical protein